MKNTISILAAISIIVISFGTASAFGDAANSPNANATSIYAFQSEREGLRHNANQISSDVRDARAQLSARASQVRNAAAQVVNSAEAAIDKVTSEEFRNEVTNRVATEVEQAKTNYKNLKTESSSGFRGSMRRFKEGVSYRMSDGVTRIKEKINPLKYSAEGVIQNIGGSAGHAADNLLGR